MATFEAQNATSTSCTVLGYFGLELFDARGHQIGAPQRDIGMGWSFSQPERVLLHPGESARFSLQWWGSYGAGGQSGSCTDASQIELTAPDQFDHVVIPARIPTGGAIRVCGNGDSFLGPASASAATSSPSASQTSPSVTVTQARDIAASHGYGLDCTPQGFEPAATLRALICHHPGAATSRGVRTFFFADHYLGTDTSEDSNGIYFVSGSGTTITLSYRLYKASDPGCCPTLGTADVLFLWDGTSLVALNPIPTADSNKDGHR